MSDKIRGITIEIGGDTTGLQKALKGVNSEIKSTQSQLKDVEKLLKLDPHNTELLAQKQKLLKQEISETKTKLDTLNAAEKKLKENGVDKNSDQFMALRREIINTSTNMNSLEKESKETAKQIKNGGKTAEEVKESWSKFGNAVAGGAKALASAAAAAGAAAAATAGVLAKATRDTANYADELMTQSKVTGVSTDSLQKYAYAAELADVSVETITGALTKSTRAMASAKSGSGSAAAAYQKLGISVTKANGELRDNEEVFWETIDALGKIDNETERDALAMEILGKSAQDLNPLIEMGAERFNELGKEAEAAGYVMSEDSLESFGDFDDQMQKLTAGTTAAKNALGTLLLPVLGELAGEGTGLLATFTNAVNDTGGDISAFGTVIETVLPQILQLIIDHIPEILELAVSVLESVAGALIDNLPSLLTSVIDILLGIVDTLIDNLDKIIDAAIEIIMALADGLIIALPRLIPAVIDMVYTIVEKLTEPETLMKLIKAAWDIIVALAKGLIQAFPRIVEAVGNITGNLRELFTKIDWSGIWDGIVNAAKKVWEGVKQVFGKVGEFFGNTFKSAWEKVTKVFSIAGNIFTDIKDGIVTAFKKIVNGLIGGINKVISKPFDAINNALQKIRDINILGAQPFKNLSTVSVPQIPMLASGGIVSGGSAIVGEAGPELLTVQNGRAVVQPLTTNNYSAPVSINVYGAAGQDVGELADQVADRIQTFIARKEAAF